MLYTSNKAAWQLSSTGLRVARVLLTFIVPSALEQCGADAARFVKVL